MEAGQILFKFHWTGSSEDSDQDAWLDERTLIMSARGERAMVMYEAENAQELRTIARALEVWREELTIGSLLLVRLPVDSASEDDDGALFDALLGRDKEKTQENRPQELFQLARVVGVSPPGTEIKLEFADAMILPEVVATHGA